MEKINELCHDTSLPVSKGNNCSAKSDGISLSSFNVNVKSFLAKVGMTGFILLALFACTVQADRTVIDLSGYNWGIYRDLEAEWVNDTIYPPPVDVASLPINPPSCGWEKLINRNEKYVHLPATVEEHFWGDNGNTEGDGGDYRGVSWFVTTVDVPAAFKGQHVFLDFESVYYRAEVFVNRKLVYYDAVSSTPFEVDITDALKYGEKNEIAVRITDPGGRFTYDIISSVKWGPQLLPGSHGFGGITGRVAMRAVDDVYIDDIWVKNKPSLKNVDVIVTMKNLTDSKVLGTYTISIHSWKNPDNILWSKTYKGQNNEPGVSEHNFSVKASRAQLWTPEDPNLYVAEVICVTNSLNIKDKTEQRFGFRWFDIGEKNGDQRLYLNGKRIVSKSVYLWGFWPINGIYATREMAERHIEQAHKFGIDMMGCHKCITPVVLLEVADEMGLLIRETSGGYWKRRNEPMPELRRDLRREKLFRMIKRDRSRPCVVIYNLGWSGGNQIEDEDIQNVKAAHILDPTRIIINRRETADRKKGEPARLFMKPDDQTEYYKGWYSQNNGISSQGNVDNLYNRPDDYHLYTEIKDEIVYRYHQSALGAPPNLQLIKKYYDEHGEPYGWRGKYFIDWFYALDEFLDSSGFRHYFPTVNDLTTSLGNVPIYHWGREIENIRMGNVTDYYEIMGWMSAQTFNHSGVVDLYANPKGDYETLTRYTRPLYLAVKNRDKVVPAGSTVTTDIFLINEMNVRGKHTLTLWNEHENGTMSDKQTFQINAIGGEEYGQLLVEGIEVPVSTEPGYTTIKATLVDSRGNVTVDGSDRILAVDLPDFQFSRSGAVIDTTGVINRMLRKNFGITLPQFTNESYDPDYIIIGPGMVNHNEVMERVANGATVIVIDRADNFAQRNTGFATHPINYRGRYSLGNATIGGNFIAGKHDLLEGLPQAQAFNWEYQCLYERRENIKELYGLRLFNGTTIVAAVADHQKEVFTALSIIPYMRGQIILTTLPIFQNLDSDMPQSIVAKRMFANFLKYAHDRMEKAQ